MTWRRAFLIAAAAVLLWLRPWRRLAALTAGARPAPQPTPGAGTALTPAPFAVDSLAAAAEPTIAEAVAVAPEDAFGAAEVEVDDFDLVTLAAMDEVDVVPFGAEPIAAAEPVAADAPAVVELDQHEELEAELIALGEPEPVELAVDDLVEVAGSADERARAVGAPAREDDLLIIEGIGPRVSTVVTAAGFTSFADLAAADVEGLRESLVAAGLKNLDPSTWPEQARIAAEGRWDDLRDLQRRIKNGRLEG